MRTILIPTQTINIEFEDAQGVPHARPFPWGEFVRGLCTDQRFIEGSPDIFAAFDLRQKLLMASDKCDLSDADWSLVSGIARKPPFAPFVLYQILPYIRAITDATPTV